MRTLLLTVLVLTSLLLLFACGTTRLYPGEKLPDDEVAFIISPSAYIENLKGESLGSVPVQIKNVDGRDLSFWRLSGFWAPLSVLPGHHVLKVMVEDHTSTHCGTVDMVAEAGITYRVIGSLGPPSVYIENLKTNRHVAKGSLEEVSYWAISCP